MSAKPVPSLALQALYDDFAVQQEKMRSLVKKQEQLTSSKTETDMVNSELEGLKPEEPLYKLMGKMLVRQEVGEARANVSQRVNLIEREL
jgi:prefoldin beta subunit